MALPDSPASDRERIESAETFFYLCSFRGGGSEGETNNLPQLFPVYKFQRIIAINLLQDLVIKRQTI